jgi:PQQ-dependent dehydrogenase (methanol/ethanol family)
MTGPTLTAAAWILTAVAFAAGFGSRTDADQSAAASGASAAVEVTESNATALTPVLQYEIRQGGGYSGQLAAADGRLYIQTPFPHSLLAFDPTQPQGPVWASPIEGDSEVLRLDCCSATAGGPVVLDGRLYANTFDGKVVALDAATGKLLWSARAADPQRGESLTFPPLRLGDTLIVGNSGDDFGARGWIAAVSKEDGHELWKRYNAGPDSDVGIGPDFAPAFPDERGHDLGIASWPPDAWQRGGGLSARPIYDPALKQLIYATGHPAPWNPDLRPGDNKWTSGIFARVAETGSARWFTSINPGDPYAFGAAGSLLAADLPWEGRSRPLLIHPDANGFVYVLDRSTGEILAADPFLPGNAATGIDLRSGRPRRNDEKAIHTNTLTRDICPGWPGATGANGLSLGEADLSTKTGLLFIPVNGLCMDMEGRNAGFIAATAYMGANLRAKSAAGRPAGAVIGWDIAERRIVWRSDEPFPVQGSVLLTEGGLLFYGTLDGWFKALDARTGGLVWRYRVASGIIGRPIAFRGSDGRPYIAVAAGIGGPIGRVAQNGIDLRDATAAHGFANALRDLPLPQSHGGTLYVFGLP